MSITPRQLHEEPDTMFVDLEPGLSFCVFCDVVIEAPDTKQSHRDRHNAPAYLRQERNAD